MGVKLRYRELANNRTRYYLDIWNETNKKRYYEFLFVAEKGEKTEKKKIAELIRGERELEMISKGSSYIPKHKKNLTLYDYLDNYVKEYNKKDIRSISSVIIKLKEFIDDKSFLIKDLTETQIKKFIDYLNNDCGLKGETPNSYYKRFKKIILQAHRDDYLSDDSFKNIRFKGKGVDSTKTLTKEVLTEEEIQILNNTDCGNDEVKKAFLFTLYSGLGLAEIKKLKWQHIVNDRLIIRREKTGAEINLQLGSSAIKLLGKKGKRDDLIFNIKHNDKFISNNGVNKVLKNWVKIANIDKHITFYSGRHTFAVRLLMKGANLKTVSDCLAHQNIDNTVKYLNHVNSLKDNATVNLD